jgi:phosphoribosylanthranilate isomerase
MVRIKICGITNPNDANVCCSLGADALGFNFYSKSPRAIAPAAAKKIIAHLPPFVQAAGIFVTGKATQMVHLARFTNVAIIQLHGDQLEAHVRSCAKHFPVIKAFRAGPGFGLEQIKPYKCASAILFDAGAGETGQFGGTGKTTDWQLAREAARAHLIILAGGLTPQNVGAAIRFVRPYAVDVASGVESRPGKKDRGKLREFFAEVARANRELGSQPAAK